MERKKKFYIKENELMRFPFMGFICLWLFLDRLKVSQSVWGIYWFVLVIFVWLFIAYKCKFEQVGVDMQSVLKRMHQSQEIKRKAEETNNT